MGSEHGPTYYTPASANQGPNPPMVVSDASPSLTSPSCITREIEVAPALAVHLLSKKGEVLRTISKYTGANIKIAGQRDDPNRARAVVLDGSLEEVKNESAPIEHYEREVTDKNLRLHLAPSCSKGTGSSSQAPPPMQAQPEWTHVSNTPEELYNPNWPMVFPLPRQGVLRTAIQRPPFQHNIKSDGRPP